MVQSVFKHRQRTVDAYRPRQVKAQWQKVKVLTAMITFQCLLIFLLEPPLRWLSGSGLLKRAAACSALLSSALAGSMLRLHRLSPSPEWVEWSSLSQWVGSYGPALFWHRLVPLQFFFFFFTSSPALLDITAQSLNNSEMYQQQETGFGLF